MLLAKGENRVAGRRGRLPLDHRLAPICVGLTSVVTAALLFLASKEGRAKNAKLAKAPDNSLVS